MVGLSVGVSVVTFEAVDVGDADINDVGTADLLFAVGISVGASDVVVVGVVEVKAVGTAEGANVSDSTGFASSASSAKATKIRFGVIIAKYEQRQARTRHPFKVRREFTHSKYAILLINVNCVTFVQKKRENAPRC